jgi:2TM domain
LNFTSDPERADERAQARRDAIAFTISGPIVTALLLVVWAAAGGGYFWPIWPLLGMSIALLVALWRAFGPVPDPQAAAAVDPRPRPRGR